MKKTINDVYDFYDEFAKHGREKQFSVDGFRFLFKYFREIEDDLGQEFELDVLDICCNYTQYGSIEEYNHMCDDTCETIEELEERTTVIAMDGQQFILENC